MTFLGNFQLDLWLAAALFDSLPPVIFILLLAIFERYLAKGQICLSLENFYVAYICESKFFTENQWFLTPLIETLFEKETMTEMSIIIFPFTSMLYILSN